MPVCPCDNFTVNTCPPYASAESVQNIVDSLCTQCFWDVPLGTLPADFCDNHPSGNFDCCEFMMVTDGNTTWYSNGDCNTWTSICKDCFASVDPGTLEADFCTQAALQGIDVDCCHPLIIERNGELFFSSDCTNWFSASSAGVGLEAGYAQTGGINMGCVASYQNIPGIQFNITTTQPNRKVFLYATGFGTFAHAGYLRWTSNNVEIAGSFNYYYSGYISFHAPVVYTITTPGTYTIRLQAYCTSTNRRWDRVQYMYWYIP